MIAQQIVEPGLDDRQFAGIEPRDQSRITIDRAGDKALARGGDGRAQPEMGHSHITDDRARSRVGVPVGGVGRQTAEHAVQPAIIGEIGRHAIGDQPLEVAVFQLPGRILLHQA